MAALGLRSHQRSPEASSRDFWQVQYGVLEILSLDVRCAGVIMVWTIATFYKFTSLPEAARLRSPLLQCCQQLGLCGTILLAPEGINATVAGTEMAILSLLQYLQQETAIGAISYQTTTSHQRPFERMKVKLKAEIVTLGCPEADPARQVGTYVAPQDWNRVITTPDTVLLDTRNDFEVKIGSFKGAINPQTRSFREFPDYVKTHLNPRRQPRVAMFCTGGIRCEKASAYLLSQGFETVYHLQGGILNYLQQVPETESLWTGECYVFDQRIAVDHTLTPGHYQMCLACGHPIHARDQQSPDYKPGIACPHCYTSLTPHRRARLQERQRQRQLGEYV